MDVIYGGPIRILPCAAVSKITLWNMKVEGGAMEGGESEIETSDGMIAGCSLSLSVHLRQSNLLHPDPESMNFYIRCQMNGHRTNVAFQAL